MQIDWNSSYQPQIGDILVIKWSGWYPQDTVLIVYDIKVEIVKLIVFRLNGDVVRNSCGNDWFSSGRDRFKLILRLDD